MVGLLLLLPIVGVIIYMLAIFIFGTVTWQGNEPIYILAQWAFDRSLWFALIYFVVGVVGIIAYFWRKPFQYLDEVIEAAEKSYDLSSDEMVELPAPFKEVESKMNRMKIDAQRNERAAREAEQRKNDLVVYLAHDLKTPLTSVIGYLTLLRDEQQISNELREKYQSISPEKAERLEDLINEFFEITRFNLSTLTLETSRVNLTRMLEQLTFEFKPMLKEKNLQCVLNAEPDIMCRIDVDKMQRVFDNLLRNAVNYSFEGTTVTIDVTAGSEKLMVAFTNEGNTIPPEKLNRIFEQFFRLDTARTSGSGGAGLGLAIAKEIVELHGGNITAESKDEKIRFELVIPIVGKS